MSNEQEIIDELQEYLDIGDNDRIALYPEEVRMCIDALEKQIAKKVIVSPYNNMKYCPICEVSVTGMYFDYCVECGQKLDWSEYDD